MKIALELSMEIAEELASNPKFWHLDEEGKTVKPTASEITRQYIIDEINAKRIDNAMKKAIENTVKLSTSDIAVTEEKEK